MSMRISTPSTYYVGTTDMQSLQNTLQKGQLQLDTQKRVVTPADDPVAAARILQLSQSDGKNTQYITNTKYVESALSISEVNLDNASNLLSSIKSMAIQAGNGALDTTQLKMIRKQLQGAIAEMVDYANASDGRGNYLFGGNQIAKVPFTLDSSYGVTYNGDSGQRDVQITSSRQIPISDAGSHVFGDANSPTALFDNLKALNSLLNTDPKPANFADQINTIMDGIDASQKNLSTSVASIGARRQENENVQNMASSLGLAYKGSISEIQDLDLPEAISKFTQTENSLKYSQQTYNRISNLSLFNYLS